jgi:nitroreductase
MSASGPQDTLRQIVGQRRSCRAFLPELVPEDIITAVLETAQLAPSWCNTQPWQVTMTSGPATDAFRSALLQHVDSEGGRHCGSDFPRPTAYTGRRLRRRRECGWALYESVGITRGDRTASARQARENFAFFGAPHAAIISTPGELGTYGAVDCGLYIATFLYAAQSHGLGAIAQAAVSGHSPFIREYFQIPDDHLVLCGLSFGWGDQEHPANSFRTLRADLAEAVQRVGEQR